MNIRYWKCPECKRVRVYFEGKLIKICKDCRVPMDLIQNKEGVRVGYGG